MTIGILLLILLVMFLNIQIGRLITISEDELFKAIGWILLAIEIGSFIMALIIYYSKDIYRILSIKLW